MFRSRSVHLKHNNYEEYRKLHCVKDNWGRQTITAEIGGKPSDPELALLTLKNWRVFNQWQQMVIAIATLHGEDNTFKPSIQIQMPWGNPLQSFHHLSPQPYSLIHFVGPVKSALRKGLTQTTERIRKFKITALTTILTLCLDIPDFYSAS